MVAVLPSKNNFNFLRFDAFCAENNFIFPEDYVKYLHINNDGELELNCVELLENASSIRYFYGTSDKEYCDLISTYDTYKDRLPLKCIPIATDDFHNQFCISLCADTYGKIYFWDHETMDTKDSEKSTLQLNDMILVADSFDTLCAKINPVDLEDIPHYSWIQVKWNQFVSWFRTQWNKF